MILNPDLIVKSPGRINLIGEHIDYNGGYVLPAAIDRKITFHFKKISSPICSIHSLEAGKFNVDLREPIQVSKIQWENYLLGVLDGLLKVCKRKIGGFECSISSDLPSGAGISSSAALECGFAKGLNTLFNLELSNLKLIEISRNAEHGFVGTKCGVMDQFAVTMGKSKQLLLLNCERLEHQLIDAKFNRYSIVLVNSNVSHNLATSEYNTRRKECKQALAIIQKQYPEFSSLAEVPEHILLSFKESLDNLLFRRAQYVIQENKRTLKAAELIQNEKIKEFGALMYQTHEGLSKEYEVSCQEIDFLVNFTKNMPQVVGSRMMGGGFGGCTINLVENDFVQEFIDQSSRAYKDEFNIESSSILVDISNGVETIKTANNGPKQYSA